MVTSMVSLLNPPTYQEVKASLVQSLYDAGIIGVLNWQTGSVPNALLETEAHAVYQWLQDQTIVVAQGLNSIATGESLTSLSYEVYQNVRGVGKITIGQIQLTDTAGAGPFQFNGTQVSFRNGLNGDLVYNGTAATYTLPQNGSVLVTVQSAGPGAVYAQVGVGAINTWARGGLPGVSVTNTSTWLTGATAQAGTDDESDDALRQRNADQWATLGVGSPPPAYAKWAKDADPTAITRVNVLTDLFLLDPGRVDVIIAGAGGAVSPSVVLAAQNNIAPLQVGGTRIPTTARAVVTSATNRTITVSGIIYVQREYNTSAFQSTIALNVGQWAAAQPIGGVISWERLLGVILLPAGVQAGIITNVSNFLPEADVLLAFDEVAVFDITGLVYVSV
jgi:hypothetical protein